MKPAGLPAAFMKNVQTVCAVHPVTLAYVFGSVARGKTDEESDLDIAVLAASTLSKEQRQELRFELMRAIADALHMPIDRMDLVVLQDVPLLLQYNVIREGRLLFERTPADRHAYVLAVEERYDDELPYIERETEMTLQRILSHAKT